MTDLLRWWSYVAWCQVRAVYQRFPGPHWLKVILMVAFVFVPAPFDPLVFALLTAVSRAARRRETRKAHTGDRPGGDGNGL